MTVLVVTAKDDVTADLVVRHLMARKHPVHRIDPADLPDKLTITGNVADGAAQFVVEDEHRTTMSGAVRAVYWRKPGTPKLDGSQLPSNVRAWIADESTSSLFGLLRTLDVLWVNHPDRNANARHKAPQLLAAKNFGLDVPETLFTNKPVEAERFRENHGQVIMKTLTQRDIEFVPARLVDPGEDLSSVAGAMHMFQRYVPKVADIRLTVVKDRFFAARITDGGVDWRAKGESATYAPTSVPRAIVKAVTKFMDHFGITYGAFDFAVAGSGPWYFLECNPNGQFGFVEAKTGMAISRAIADLLAEGPDSLMQREGLAVGHRQSSTPS
ncbi:MvdC/MvdD family ATP grasp protein [Streptomyces sp. NPDC059568]|uniref:MvdC/MvdD family ATP grasp protein n=1 Tax=Streptomyces sp. NPDC059568 TaxID=3346868 RepID=UPI0036921C51